MARHWNKTNKRNAVVLLLFVFFVWLYLYTRLKSSLTIKDDITFWRREIHSPIVDVQPPQWERMIGIRLWELVRPEEDTVIVGPRIKRQKPLVVIFVCSYPSSFERRTAIRETWAKDARKKGVLVLFFVGTISSDKSVENKVLLESRKYRDIIQDTVMEGYSQLTVKVLRMMKYYLKVYVEGKTPSDVIPLFAKVDDDVILNLDNLMSHKILKTVGYSEKTGAFEGKVIAGAKLTWPRPDRNYTSKHYMPYSVYGQLWYPSHIRGMFYTITGNLVKEIYERSLKLEYFPFEDIFITGIVAHYLTRAEMVDLEQVYFNVQNLSTTDLQNAIVLHEFKSPKSMHQMYLLLHEM